MGNLAGMYSALGRHADALAMQEKVLEHYRRVLPADHPDIGEGCAGRDAFHSTCLDFEEWGFDLNFRHGHVQSCHVILRSREARGCACDAGKGAGVQASCAA